MLREFNLKVADFTLRKHGFSALFPGSPALQYILGGGGGLFTTGRYIYHCEIRTPGPFSTVENGHRVQIPPGPFSI